MELTEIISALEENTSRKFPRLVVEDAIAQQEAITPLLLKALEDAKTNIEEIDDKPSYFLHVYALYLLAQFREPKAYPLVVDFFSIPGEITLDVTGDLVTENLGRILASVYDGDLKPIKQLIENSAVNEYVRGAAVNSLLTLVAQEVISREEVIQYFQELFSTLEKDESYFWTDLVFSSAKLCPSEELMQLLDQAFEEDVVDTYFFGREDVDYYQQKGVEEALTELRKDPHHALIGNAVAEMEWWACFQEQPGKMPKIPAAKPRLTSTMKGLWDSPSGGASKAQKKKKRQAQKQSRKKNRRKKK
ncbi:MAG: DUF1186 domain-containing protein [Leptolyngbyaceae cyanobacterium MO_188.B28]|nr:DUF1186 domain-containing protein [Leptolyngbyaceae cyanobacterium MO_188.B28]